MAAQKSKKPYYETTCMIHGRPMNEDDSKLKIMRVKVNKPRHKRDQHSGCPLCRKEAAAAAKINH